MKGLSLIVWLLVLAFAAFAQAESPIVYQIQSVYRNADLNEKAITKFKKNIDLRSDRDEILKLFKPVKGNHKVILFMASAEGLSFRETKEIFHNILILKIDENGEILDGLEYGLEWAEPPLTSRFVRITNTGVKLQKGLNISQLDLRTFEANQSLPLSGILDNFYNLREVF